MLDLIKKRRSIRKFTEEKLTRQEKDQLLTAALLMPSSKDRKPLAFVATEDRAVMERLKQCKNAGAAALDTAAMAVVILGNSDKSDVWVEDGSIAATAIMLEAEALGLGANWIQMRLRQGLQDESEKQVRQTLNIPENYGVLAIMAIGRKAEEKPPYTDADADFSKIHWDKF